FVTHETIEYATRLLRIDEVLIDLSWMLEGSIDGAFRDLIEHHAEGGLGWSLRNDLFGEMLADCFAFASVGGCGINRFSFFCGLLQFRNDLLVVSFLRVRDELVRRLEVVIYIDSESLRRQIFDMAYRGLNQIVLS